MSAKASGRAEALVDEALVLMIKSADPWTGTSFQSAREGACEALLAYIAALEAVAEAARASLKSSNEFAKFRACLPGLLATLDAG